MLLVFAAAGSTPTCGLLSACCRAWRRQSHSSSTGAWVQTRYLRMKIPPWVDHSWDVIFRRVSGGQGRIKRRPFWPCFPLWQMDLLAPALLPRPFSKIYGRSRPRMRKMAEWRVPNPDACPPRPPPSPAPLLPGIGVTGVEDGSLHWHEASSGDIWGDNYLSKIGADQALDEGGSLNVVCHSGLWQIVVNTGVRGKSPCLPRIRCFLVWSFFRWALNYICALFFWPWYRHALLCLSAVFLPYTVALAFPLRSACSLGPVFLVSLLLRCAGQDQLDMRFFDGCTSVALWWAADDGTLKRQQSMRRSHDFLGRPQRGRRERSP